MHTHTPDVYRCVLLTDLGLLLGWAGQAAGGGRARVGQLQASPGMLAATPEDDAARHNGGDGGDDDGSDEGGDGGEGSGHEGHEVREGRAGAMGRGEGTGGDASAGGAVGGVEVGPGAASVESRMGGPHTAAGGARAAVEAAAGPLSGGGACVVALDQVDLPGRRLREAPRAGLHACQDDACAQPLQSEGQHCAKVGAPGSGVRALQAGAGRGLAGTGVQEVGMRVPQREEAWAEAGVRALAGLPAAVRQRLEEAGLADAAVQLPHGRGGWRGRWAEGCGSPFGMELPRQVDSQCPDRQTASAQFTGRRVEHAIWEQQPRSRCGWDWK